MGSKVVARGKWAGRVDDNQKEIVDQLRGIGISVAFRHDDIICGYRGHTFWFEVKNPATCFLADGLTFRKGSIKKSQNDIRKTWAGQYDVVTDVQGILFIINRRCESSLQL